MLIIHINREFVAKAFGNKFPDTSTSLGNEFSKDMFTGKPCVISRNYVDGIMHYFYNQHVVTDEIVELKIKEILLLTKIIKQFKIILNIFDH